MKKIYKIVIENKKLKMIKESNEKIVRPKSKQELVKIIKEFIDKNGKKANLNFIDTSLITDMSNIFSIPFCRFFNGDISEWDTSNVRNMSQMFKNSMFNGDISNWDVSNVEDMSSMFENSRFNGDISKWNISSVKYMDNMFAYSYFKQDISKWNTSKVKDMNGMFYNSKFNGDISNWDVLNVENMEYMFCYSKFDKDIKVLTEDMLGKIMNIQLDLKQKKN